ncbi:riboflavin biosynthesis protein [Tersicoccus solisilvae]|uniref:Riboflavin biosynthesis protein n=1 Tax=Tersicoccus solisilvae TaxID=1882339 RepID=A0ABQ1PPZ1_9MICC|nr:bifunctional riboflavin kinase/FAD synthetase [Tersicoccus solisilvae]GGD00841.1 riboflavin biosynthesis protein [Tersicoccus solisilvae]
MQYFPDVAAVPAGFGPSVVTIGNFDGVHRGHQQVIAELVRQARDRAVPAVVVTFDPHPATVHRPESAPTLIMGLADRIEALAGLGVDAVLVMHYTAELARTTAEDFVTGVFLDTLGAQAVVVGHDVRWGRDNAGDREEMERLGAVHGFAVTVIEEYQFGVGDPDDPEHPAGGLHERRGSSTWIREALDEGDVRTAATVLGRPHRVRGLVVHGAARGRALGFPTANLDADAVGYIPADGVYAGWLIDERGERWPAAISVGSNPTFEGVSRQVEAHVIDRPAGEEVDVFDLYGQRVAVEFIERLRGMVAYAGVDALIEQMRLDIDATRTLLQDAPTPGHAQRA